MNTDESGNGIMGACRAIIVIDIVGIPINPQSSDGYFLHDERLSHKGKISNWFLEHDVEFTTLWRPPVTSQPNTTPLVCGGLENLHCRCATKLFDTIMFTKTGIWRMSPKTCWIYFRNEASSEDKGDPNWYIKSKVRLKQRAQLV